MSNRSSLRLFVLRVLVLSLLLTLGSRLWYLQVVAGEDFAKAAAKNNTQDVVTTAARGMILDARGRPLVRNRTALVISVTRSELVKQPQRGKPVLGRLARVLGVPLVDLEQKIRPCGGGVTQPCWNGSPYQPVPVLPDADAKVALAIEEHREDYPGVHADYQPVRDYPYGSMAGHSLGYLSPITEQEVARYAAAHQPGYRGTSLIGRSGLEKEYDAQLRGVDGVQTVTINHVGTVTGVARETPARGGSNVVLSLDADVQRVAETALHRGILNARKTTDRSGRHYRATAGAAVVLEAKTGRVVALASEPSYAPSLFVGGISQRDYAALQDERAGVPLISRATQGLFAPASTFKIVSTSAAVKDGYPINGMYPCPGAYTVGNRSYRNFESRPLGSINLHTALVKSCDTIFYKFAYEQWLRDERRIGGKQSAREPMVRMAQAYGLGRKTGIDLPEESKGRVADRSYRRAYWAATKDVNCRRAKTGYPEERDATRRAYLTKLARENCIDGNVYRAGDAVNFSIGQGDTVVTPLQLAVAYGALANGGKVMAPTLARAIVAPGGTVTRLVQPRVRGRLPVNQATLQYIRSALADVPLAGTGRCAFGQLPGCGRPFPLDRLRVAGKTGTGQVTGKQDTAWFASFAPAGDPRYVVVAMVAEGGQGGRTAAPIVREIYSGIYGFEGHKAALPGGVLPTKIPVVGGDGLIRAARGRAPVRHAPAPVPSPVPSPVGTALSVPTGARSERVR